MNAEISTSRHDTTAQRGDVGGLFIANRLAEAIKSRWRSGEPPDAVRVLESHPELQSHRSVVLDLAYAEYRLRQQAGESIGAESFARRFPSLEQSLYLLIEVQSLLSNDPELQLLQESLAWPEAGSRFLQFELIAEIGRGAFGRVFLATEPNIGDRKIVVKVMPRGGTEANILGKLRHPNIVPIYSYQNDADLGLAAFCMPYLGRATLCDVLAPAFQRGRAPLESRAIIDAIDVTNGNLDLGESPPPAPALRKGSYIDGVIYIVAQLADALAHSHGRGIYHRDLKPSNILMTADGRPLLLDFNLSIDSRLPVWKIGGTLPYMAPEELAKLANRARQPHDSHYDPRSDLFSLGVIFYELLCGALPFGAIPRNRSLEEAAAQLHNQQAAGPRPIRELNDRVDRRLARLVESCLAFEAEGRPATARQLAAALRCELSVARRGRRWVGNHSGLAAGACGIVLLLILAVALFFSLRPPYDVRQYRLGLQRLDGGEYAVAADSLTNSIRYNPDSGDALYARGRAFHRLGEYQIAFRDYTASYRLCPSADVVVCKGYCLSRLKSHKAAISAYGVALEQGYTQPALVQNNIGYSYLMLGQLADAEKHLRLAIRLDGNLQAPRYNMMVLVLQSALQGRSISGADLEHATKALEIGPRTADLYRVASALFAAAAHQDNALIQPAVEYVGKAVEFGAPPEAFLADSCYTVLQKEPAFQQALARTASRSKSPEAVQLIDPLGNP
ncbi:MAG: protein kinase [Pirellulaceae bacterium]|nr:protein kinase [Pirellulaceae bacterium]